MNAPRPWYIAALSLLLTLVFAASAMGQAPNVSLSAPNVLPVAANDRPATLAKPVVSMGAGIDNARRQNGLQPVVVSGRLTRASFKYAQYMLAHNRWAHASNIRVKGFHRVGEILGMAPTHVTIDQVINAWLQSPVHRAVMLDGSFRYFGIGSATGRFQGKRQTVWVVRFGS